MGRTGFVIRLVPAYRFIPPHTNQLMRAISFSIKTFMTGLKIYPTDTPIRIATGSDMFFPFKKYFVSWFRLEILLQAKEEFLQSYSSYLTIEF